MVTGTRVAVRRRASGSLGSTVVARAVARHAVADPYPEISYLQMPDPCGQRLLSIISVGGACLSGPMAATTRTRADRAEEVLVAARDNQRAIADLEIERLLLAVEWAAMFEGEEPDPDDWATHPVEIAGDGAPVDESAVAEFALALGMKHETGIRYVGDAIELRYRLPRIWRRVMAGEVAVFKARKIAQDTRTLSMDAAAAVDRHLALIARRRSWAEIERQITRARAEYDPEEAERRRIAAAEKRCIEVHYRGISRRRRPHHRLRLPRRRPRLRPVPHRHRRHPRPRAPPRRAALRQHAATSVPVPTDCGDHLSLEICDAGGPPAVVTDRSGARGDRDLGVDGPVSAQAGRRSAA